MSNKAVLAQLDDKVIRDIPIDQIELLLEELAEMKAKAKSYDDLISSEMSRRFAHMAAAVRHETGKVTGTVRIEVGDTVIVADLPKVVEWDQAGLRAQSIEIDQNWTDKATDYISVKYSVEERKFASWPQSLRESFQSSRTVKTGKATFKIEAKKDAG